MLSVADRLLLGCVGPVRQSGVMSGISGGDREASTPLRTGVVAGVGAVVAGLGVMALIAVLAGVSIGLLGVESDFFIRGVVVPALVPMLAIIVGVCAGRGVWRWIVAPARRP